MKTGTIARIGAAGFVVTALALSIVQLNEPARTNTQTVFVADDEIDPLRAELRRCRSIGQAAASDTRCLRVIAAIAIAAASWTRLGSAPPEGS